MGLIPGDSITITYELVGFDGSVGDYEIVATLEDPNYDVTITNGTLSVVPAFIGITTDNFTISCDDDLPEFTSQITGASDTIPLIYVVVDDMGAPFTGLAGTYNINAQPVDSDSYNVQFNIPCLLYTSPSPRDRTRSRMPSSA